MEDLVSELDAVVTRTEELWEGLRGARLFITGGTGFFGCWLLETLLRANDRLDLGVQAVTLTRDGGAFASKAPHLARHAAVTLHPGDLRSFVFPGGAFSHVVHAGMEASTGLDARDPATAFDVIVHGTARALAFAHQAGATRFLFTSSGAIYGRQPPELSHVPEDYRGAPDPSDPRAVYAEGKRAAEMLCAVHAGGSLQPVIARCFAFVGPYLPLDAHFAVGNFIRDALAGGPIRVQGDGTPYRSYLYGSDLAVWLWTILLQGQPLRPYNVGSGDAVTIAGLAEAVRSAVAPAAKVEVAARPEPGAQPSRYVPSVRRAEQELGLRPTVSLEDAIARTARFVRQW